MESALPKKHKSMKQKREKKMNLDVVGKFKKDTSFGTIPEEENSETE